MNRARTVPALLPVLALALLAACGSTRRDEPYVEELPVPGESTGREADPGIERRLAHVIESSREVGGVTTVRLSLRNVSAEPLEAAWTVDWYDRAGRRIAPARRTWRQVELEAGAATPIEFSAPSSAAESWRLVAVDPASLPR